MRTTGSGHQITAGRVMGCRSGRALDLAGLATASHVPVTGPALHAAHGGQEAVARSWALDVSTSLATPTPAQMYRGGIPVQHRGAAR
jgi:hypothetical protein